MWYVEKNEMIFRLINERRTWNYWHDLTEEESDADIECYRTYLKSLSIEALEDEYVEITGNELAL